MNESQQNAAYYDSNAAYVRMQTAKLIAQLIEEKVCSTYTCTTRAKAYVVVGSQAYPYCRECASKWLVE